MAEYSKATSGTETASISHEDSGSDSRQHISESGAKMTVNEDYRIILDQRPSLISRYIFSVEPKYSNCDV